MALHSYTVHMIYMQQNDYKMHLMSIYPHSRNILFIVIAFKLSIKIFVLKLQFNMTVHVCILEVRKEEFFFVFFFSFVIFDR